ncbi:DUF6382 domain-containing protein [Ruminiclostridium sufflavum]|uniref:DUF6382 domain-containing protein n=1 Tax=Ruminiclostridium sufflavum TaxID=396504 RepID=UPI000D7CA91B|nr:DUF6382 domain-containing protein [Ruminiclostridium sufflavum]
MENGIKILYENDSTSNYLVLKTGIDKNIINYQVQMLLNNRLNGLLDFNINRIGNELNCFYNITSKCTLSGFLTRKYFTRDEFLKTILSIINNFYKIKNYLLYDNNILLDESLIYVEPDSIDIYFVYLPFQHCKNDIRAFFMKVIFELANFSDEYSDNYIQKLLEVIKNEKFSLCNLKAVIEGLLYEDIKKHAKEPEDSDSNNLKEAQASAKSSTVLMPKKGSEVNVYENEIDINNLPVKKPGTDKNIRVRHNANLAGADRLKAESLKIPDFKKTSKQGNKENARKDKRDKMSAVDYNEDEKVYKGKTKNTVLLALVLLQGITATGFIFSIRSSFVRMSDSPKAAIIIVALIFTAIDVLIIKIVREREKQTDKPVNMLENKEMGTDALKPLQFIAAMMKNKEGQADKELLGKEYKTEEEGYNINENCNGETVIIKMPKLSEYPHLRAKEGEESFEINKDSILIGRMEAFVDYEINNGAIGKIHAEIIREGDEFYVMDCNSKNGTFINDCRILPNTKTRINSRDKLRFANKEFVFSADSN